MALLQKNPLTMAGQLQRCWLFNFQGPPAAAAAHEARPEICYEVAPIAYRWRRGTLIAAGGSG